MSSQQPEIVVDHKRDIYENKTYRDKRDNDEGGEQLWRDNARKSDLDERDDWRDTTSWNLVKSTGRDTQNLQNEDEIR